MSRTISAIFDAGVFRPLEPINLADGTQVELHLSFPNASVARCNASGSQKRMARLH